jgi:hypothetical protein
MLDLSSKPENQLKTNPKPPDCRPYPAICAKIQPQKAAYLAVFNALIYKLKN